MAVKIQFRRGTAAQWSAANPVLAEAELGYETDTGQFKIGDGVTVWNQLDYFGTETGNSPLELMQLRLAKVEAALTFLGIDLTDEAWISL